MGCNSDALNEGRPFRAGNPHRLAAHRPLGPRSTKAGPSGPATPFRRYQELSARAQRRPALPGRQPCPSATQGTRVPRRSTKAGPSGPATRGRRRRRRGRRSGPLNEGRPFRAGNPQGDDEVGHARGGAQRRPALPGRQPRVGVPTEANADAQRRPALPGRQPSNCLHSDRTRPHIFAQRRPALPGRQPSPPGATILRSSHAQRRPALPGRQPTSLLPASLTSSRAQRRPALPGRQPPPNVDWQTGSFQAAQRRPALPGRQPSDGAHPRRPVGRRSTKAGPSGPATPCSRGRHPSCR